MKTSVKIGFIIIILLGVGFAFKLISDAQDARENQNQNQNEDIDVVIINPDEEPVIEPTYINSSADDIQVELPYPGSVTGKEFMIIGKARGYWFFEASFPVELRDMNGNVLGGGIATAESDWMTTEFVNFSAEMQTPSAFVGPAILILKRDNPSDMPENDASVSFPITVEF